MNWFRFLVTTESAPWVKAIPAMRQSKGSISFPSRFRVSDISAALYAESKSRSSISRLVMRRWRSSILRSVSDMDLYTPWATSNMLITVVAAPPSESSSFAFLMVSGSFRRRAMRKVESTIFNFFFLK